MYRVLQENIGGNCTFWYAYLARNAHSFTTTPLQHTHFPWESPPSAINKGGTPVAMSLLSDSQPPYH